MFVGDWHGDSDHAYYIIQTAVDNDVVAIIQLGDFGCFPEFDWYWKFVEHLECCLDFFRMPLFFIDGNHDDLNHLMSRPVTDSGMRQLSPHALYVPRGMYFELGGHKILALGGAYSIDKSSRKPGVSWWPTEQIEDIDVKRALSQPRPDIMITHDAPNEVPDQRILRPGGRRYVDAAPPRQQLQRVFNKHRPDLWIHGHYHRRYDMMAGNTKFVGLANEGTGRHSWYLVPCKEEETNEV